MALISLTPEPEPNLPPISSGMLENLVRQAKRQLAKTDVFAYGEYVFGYEPADHHREMVDFA